MREDGTTASDSVKRQWASASVGETVVLLETAEWNQSWPYNMQCPMDGSVQCVTGCVSTATAILMRYIRYPDRGIGETEEYTTSTNNILVEARNPEHEYDWDNMPLETPSNSVQMEAVSGLLADIGASLQANYGSDETGASVSLSVLRDHFGYSPNMYREYAENHNQDDWNARIMDELSSTGPVLYIGRNDTVGHQFVLDGYTDDGYFHINWGWGGLSDGFFLLPKISFPSNQCAYFNMKPADGSESESVLRVYSSGMSLDTDEVSRNVYFNIAKAYARNVSATDFTGYVCFALTDSEGNIKEWISKERHSSTGLEYNHYRTYTNVPCLITADIAVGDRIRMFYEDSEDGEWKLMLPNTDDTVWEIVVREEVVSSIKTTNGISQMQMMLCTTLPDGVW